MVMSHGAMISVIQEINEELSPVWFCQSCGFESLRAVQVCVECMSKDVIKRERKIWGWLGMQRYLHRADFGLNFLRNGRKILSRDKRLFKWGATEDTAEVEYPIELPMAGRIIGEIHCDHVPVNLSKDAFDYASADWQEVCRVIRGTGPLGYRRSVMLGYPVNDSPLARLFHAFRRNDPGARYLIPGDGVRAIHERTRMWADRFYSGDPEFQTDAIWYEAVLDHDRKKAINQANSN